MRHDQRLSAICCRIEYQQQNQQMFINGQPVNAGNKIPLIVCPSCNAIIAQCQPNAGMLEIVTACQQQLVGKVNYCKNCGQKLLYPEIIEV